MVPRGASADPAAVLDPATPAVIPATPAVTPATPAVTPGPPEDAGPPSGQPGAPPAAAVPWSSVAPRPAAPEAPRFQWEPFGFLRLQYIVVQNDPNVAYVGRDDGFELQNARLGFRGTLDRRVAFVLALDGAVDERLQVNTPDGKLRVGLRDAFADVRLGGRWVARGGFFDAWVDPEALVADTRRELVDHPIESRGMRATEGFQAPGLTPGRSLGAAIRLEPEPPEHGAGRAGRADGSPGVAISFELAVQNGADEFSSNNDNDKPAISATLLARLPHDSWVMAAARYNPRTVGDLPFRQDEDDLQATAGARLAIGPLAFGGGVIVQRTSYATTGGPAQRAFGGHGQVMVELPVALPIAVGYRFGILDPSSLIPTDRVMEHTASAVLGVPRYRMRVQLQVTHVIEQAARELSNDHAIGRVGDFLLENDQIRLVIADTGVDPKDPKKSTLGRVNTMFGGTLVDADLRRVGGAGARGNDQLAELLPGFVFSVINPTSVTVTRDGNDGTAAEVTVTGTPSDLLQEVYLLNTGLVGTTTRCSRRPTG